ncbi:RidA family protein [Sphingomonas sp. RHCKR7]|uniref:Rid family hydrolase n=1 Tax=Sphingomonas folli TaxID=2862497 RepID=UPI001CA519FF|nr:Rid family hydrolase [Sphingomonas folli]MBW6526415.1 RidA family protein [Sphingomonas folli]
MTEGERDLVDTGSAAERAAGFSQAVRVGAMVFVSGVNASDGGAVEHARDAAGQARVTLTKIAHALERAGASLEDVVRTRVFLRDAADAPAVAAVHLEVFGDIRPANSFVVAAPIGDDRLVEIEADAVIGSGRS